MTTCHCAALRRATRAVTNLYDAALAPAGLTVAQFALLRGFERHGPISISAAARIMRLDRTTLGRNIAPLRRMGLIGLAAGDQDARERLVRLTAAGGAKIAAARPHWRATQARLETLIGRDKLALLHELLDGLETALPDPPASASAPTPTPIP